MKRFLDFLPFAIFLLLSILLYLLLAQNLKLSQQQPDFSTDRALPEFNIAGSARRPHIAGLSSADIQGASLLHITASWCGVCKIEHPLLMKLSKKIPIYGIAWKDEFGPLSAWLDRAGSPYERIGADDGKLAIELGVTGTPETFVISKDRRIIAHIKGPLTDEMVEREILPRIK